MSFLDSAPIIGSYRKSSRAEDIVSSAKREYRRATRKLDDANNESKQLVDELFDLKVNIATNDIEDAIDALEKCQKINRMETNIAKDDLGAFNKKALPVLKQQSLRFLEMAGEGVKGTAVGAALSLGSVSTVSALGAASTGTAISSLSGAAASNATIAWFGGGALSAGGAGIAGGAMVLGGITLAPLLVFGAYKYAAHAEKKLSEAHEYSNQVDEAIAQIDAAIEIATKMNGHVTFYTETLSRIKSRLVLATQKLLSVLNNHNSTDKELNIAKYQLILFIKAIKRLLEVELFDGNQNPTSESIRIMGHILETDSHSSLVLAESLESGNAVVKPDGIKYLSEIEPGNDSPAFFWLLDSYQEYKKNSSVISKQNSDKTSEPFTIKDVLGLWVMSAIVLSISVYFDSFLFILISIFFILVAPLIWLNDKVTEGGTIQSIVGLAIIAIGGFLTYLYFWG